MKYCFLGKNKTNQTFDLFIKYNLFIVDIHCSLDIKKIEFPIFSISLLFPKRLMQKLHNMLHIAAYLILNKTMILEDLLNNKMLAPFLAFDCQSYGDHPVHPDSTTTAQE